jgi:transposase
MDTEQKRKRQVRIPASTKRQIFSLRRGGCSYREIAKRVKVATRTAMRYAQEADANQNDLAAAELGGVPVEAIAQLIEFCRKGPCHKCGVMLLWLTSQRSVWCSACGHARVRDK